MSEWIPTAAAVAATLVALVVLWPLRGHSRRVPFIGACVAIGIVGFSLYSLVGTPEAVDAAREDPTSLSDGVRDLEQALAREPQRADGWALLGRSELALGNIDKANQAFARAVALAPDEVPLLVEAAQTRAQGDAAKQFDDTALQWLKHAQQVEPNNERAGWLIGITQRQRGQDAEAAATWEALLPRLEPAAANALREQIAIAREKAGMPAATSEATAPPTGLDIEVTLAAGKQPPAGTQVFVIARIPGGPPMPVAVQKHPATDLPLKIRLTDADSPMPTAKLSSLEAVEVFARLSASGHANRQQGDIDSTVVTVKLPHKGKVELTL